MTGDPAATTGPSLHTLARAREFLVRHSLAVAIGIALAALAVRMVAAAPGYLNPDEILHVLIAGNTTFADSLARIIRAQSPHPFLHVLILYLLNLAGASDFVLRLPSVIAGALVPLFCFLWMRRVAGVAAGIGTALLLAFLPETIRISAQVREYALLMMLIAAALYLLEVGANEQRAGPMLASGGLMLLALATHYAAIWVAPALAAFGFVRLRRSRASRRAWLAWTTVQVAFVAGLAVAWFTHFSLLAGQTQTTATEGWLRMSYFHGDAGQVLLYPFRQATAVFRYLFSGTATRWAGLLAAGTGVVMTVLRRRLALAFLLALPFVVNCAASYLGFYPFGGTRHVLPLSLFAAGAIGFLASRTALRRPLLVLAVVGSLVAAANIWPSWPSQFIHQRNQRRELMAGAIEYLHDNVPPGGLVFCDEQSALLLRYYLGRERTLHLKEEIAGFIATAAGDCHVVEPPSERAFWSFTARSFSREFSRLVRSWRIGLDEVVWIFDGGWGYNLKPDLEWNYGVRLPGAQMFGEDISAFPMTGRRLPGSAQAAAALKSLAGRVAAPWRGQVWQVLWPSDQDTCGPAAQAAAGLAPRLVSYRQLRENADTEAVRFEEHLPALAFWVIGNLENQPDLFRQMDLLEGYEAAGFRFDLLATDPDTIAAVYAVTAGGG